MPIPHPFFYHYVFYRSLIMYNVTNLNPCSNLLKQVETLDELGKKRAKVGHPGLRVGFNSKPKTSPFLSCCFESRVMRRFNWVLRHLQARKTFDSALGLRQGSQKPLFERYIHATGISCSSARNYYDVLGVSPTATREEIKKSFHELAKKFHPDTNRNNPSAKRKFQEIREAYETLGNSERREEYDKLRYQNSGDVNNDSGDAERFRRAYQSNFSASFHDIFSEIFEDETGQYASDIRVELPLSFSEAAKGCTKRLSFPAYVFCDICDGLGHPRDAAMRVCPTCRGVGRVTIPPFTATCQTCKGSGHIVKEHCMSCRGSGVVQATKTVELVIPGGVESEATIPITGAGNVRSRTSQPGNLYIKLKVANDSIFSRDGSDIYVDANISFTQAILGGKVVVPTLSGKIQLDIPKGAQPGQLLVLRGKGLPKKGFFVDHGDQYVRFRINFPTEVNERQRAILEEFAKEEINNEMSGSPEGSWWNRTGPQIIRDFSLLVLLVLLLNKLTG